jgi:hypothetical protein
MKNLRQYLIENARTYHYTIKILGDVDKKFIDMFKYNLTKFDPVKMDEPKTTPIQKSVAGFPDAENDSLTIIKVEFRYPATEPMIQQCAQACGCNINRIRMLTTDFVNDTEKQNLQYKNQVDNSPLLMQTEMEDNGKEASKEYANQYLDRVMPKKPSVEMQFAAKATPIAPKNNKEESHLSPLSRTTKPQRPATGASKAK